MEINPSRAAISLIRMIATVLFCCGLARAYSTGPDPRYTGAPGDAQGACTACHIGQKLNSGPGSVRILLPNGNSYTPGVKQHIMVQLSDPLQRRWGFQMSARLKNNLSIGQAGDFTPTDAFTQVICENGNPKPCQANAPVEFIEHTSAGTRLGTQNGVAFEFDWTPPASDAGNIVFYVAGNAANGDGNLTGDHIYTSNVEITSAGAGAPTTTTGTVPIPVTKYAQHTWFPTCRVWPTSPIRIW